MPDKRPYLSEDTDLAVEISQGSTYAFKRLYEKYHRPLFYLAKNYLRDHEQAEDATQDIFVKLWDKRAAIEPSRSLKNFLFTMLKNHLLNTIRERKSKIISMNEIGEAKLPIQNVTEEQVEYNDYREFFERGIKELPGNMRMIYVMKISGFSNNQIADKLFISVHTVKSQYYNGSKIVRNYLLKSTRNHYEYIVSTHEATPRFSSINEKVFKQP